MKLDLRLGKGCSKKEETNYSVILEQEIGTRLSLPEVLVELSFLFKRRLEKRPSGFIRTVSR